MKHIHKSTSQGTIALYVVVILIYGYCREFFAFSSTTINRDKANKTKIVSLNSLSVVLVSTHTIFKYQNRFKIEIKAKLLVIFLKRGFKEAAYF